jgi:hypothetical protein
VSDWLAQAAADRLRNDLLGAALDAWEAEDGAFGDEKLDAAAATLGVPADRGGTPCEPRANQELCWRSTAGPSVGALLCVAQHELIPVRTSAAVVAQLWRHGAHQAQWARVLAGVAAPPLDLGTGKHLGALLGTSRTCDVGDAHVASLTTSVIRFSPVTRRPAAPP